MGSEKEKWTSEVKKYLNKTKEMNKEKERKIKG